MNRLREQGIEAILDVGTECEGEDDPSIVAGKIFDRILAITGRLREVVEKGLHAPSGEPICCCHNRNAVKAGMETPCWYCELRVALAGNAESPAEPVVPVARCKTCASRGIALHPVPADHDYDAELLTVTPPAAPAKGETP